MGVSAKEKNKAGQEDGESCVCERAILDTVVRESSWRR